MRILYSEPLVAIAGQPRGAGKPSAGATHKFRFDAFGRSFVLSLLANQELNALIGIARNGPQLKLYEGRLENIAGSWARLAAKGAQLQGLIWDGRELYIIEPADRVRDVASSLPATSSNIVFRLSETLIEPGMASCGTLAAEPRNAGEAYQGLVSELKYNPTVMPAAGASLRLEISALGDSAPLARYASEQEAREEILRRLNNVDGIYSSQLGIELQVPSLNVTDATGDPFSATTSPSSLLSELAQLRRRSLELRSYG